MEITPKDLEEILKKIQEMPPEELEKLGKAWSKVEKSIKQGIADSMTVNVPNIPGTVGTDCSPERSERIARQEDTPGYSAWTVVRTWTQDSMFAKAKEYVPSLEHLRYGFAELTRTWNYTCQKQVCSNGRWADDGHEYACNQIESKTVEAYGGPGDSAPLQAWDDASIRQSIASGWYR